ALLLLRELRTELADWEAPLVEAARAAGATWADLARPMGVASRQAAENRYLRLAPAATTAGTTGAKRVKAVRDRRAAERAVTDWARANAADLRRLAAQVTALTDLPSAARPALDRLHTALGTPDAAELLTPLAAVRPHLGTHHPQIAHRLDDLTQHTDQLRHDSDHRRA
ncbi:type III effector protein, partial [Kitasatospora sp. NPDC001683]